MFYFSHPFGIKTPSTGDLSRATTTVSSQTVQIVSGNGLSSADPEVVECAKRHWPNHRLKESVVTDRTNTDRTGGGGRGEDDEEMKDRIRLSSYVPWSQNTWRRTDLVSPLTEIVTKRHGKSNSG